MPDLVLSQHCGILSGGRKSKDKKDKLKRSYPFLFKTIRKLPSSKPFENLGQENAKVYANLTEQTFLAMAYLIGLEDQLLSAEAILFTEAKL